MALPPLDTIVGYVMTGLIALALIAALVLTMIARRHPTTAPLAVAAGLIVGVLLITIVTPPQPPAGAAVAIAALATALAVVGGDPIVRHVLHLAGGETVREGRRGGILIGSDATSPTAEAEILRGGITIGFLERLAAVLSIIAGYPEAVAIIVALKGVGRFTELATPAARERFIVGTLASLLWAGAIGATVRLLLS